MLQSRLICRKDLKKKDLHLCFFFFCVCVSWYFKVERGRHFQPCLVLYLNKGTQVEENAKIEVGRIVRVEAREKEKQKKMQQCETFPSIPQLGTQFIVLHILMAVYLAWRKQGRHNSRPDLLAVSKRTYQALEYSFKRYFVELIIKGSVSVLQWSKRHSVHMHAYTQQ